MKHLIFCALWIIYCSWVGTGLVRDVNLSSQWWAFPYIVSCVTITVTGLAFIAWLWLWEDE